MSAAPATYFSSYQSRRGSFNNSGGWNNFSQQRYSSVSSAPGYSSSGWPNYASSAVYNPRYPNNSAYWNNLNTRRVASVPIYPTYSSSSWPLTSGISANYASSIVPSPIFSSAAIIPSAPLISSPAFLPTTSLSAINPAYGTLQATVSQRPANVYASYYQNPALNGSRFNMNMNMYNSNARFPSNRYSLGRNFNAQREPFTEFQLLYTLINYCSQFIGTYG